MRLIKFQITNYRSINDSGPIEVKNRTALVGRNESGKSNLIKGLESLNPPDGLQKLTDVKDFPRDRELTNYSEELLVVQSLWELSDDEQKELSKIFPRSKEVKRVKIDRPYAPTHLIKFEELMPLNLDSHRISKAIETLSSHSEEKIKQFTDNLANRENPAEWAKNVAAGIQALKTSGIELNGTSEVIEDLAIYCREIMQDNPQLKEAEQWVIKNMPIFIYLDEYPELPGHQDIDVLAKKQRTQFSEQEKNFLKLIKVAGLNIEQLRTLLLQNHEQRHQLVNRAGAVVTRKIRELWKDRQLKIRFNLDSQHFDTLISDPNKDYDVDVNLDERSRGFRWFLGFYITFAADTQDGPAKNAILLLDEPGLFLHAVAQEDLLKHFAKDFKNQIIYTTHSPFMIPVDDIASVKTVNIEAHTGTTVTNNPTGDSKTLFPLQAALGYNISQTLFIGEKNLVVEGVTDLWYLSAISDYVKTIQKQGLIDGLVITPAGGANKISYMVALLSAQHLQVLVLLDAERQADLAKNEMIREKLIRDNAIVSVNEVFPTSIKEADIEDLFDPGIYETFVRESYSNELKGKKLILNPKIPRIITRMEEGFKGLGLDFHKTRPAKIFLHRMGENPESILINNSLEKFIRLFSIIEKRLLQLKSSTQETFR